jgi:hypothetical protein
LVGFPRFQTARSFSTPLFSFLMHSGAERTGEL